jgi:type IV pilus assembly protein PilX
MMRLGVRPGFSNTQNGMALIVSLVLLVVLTLIALAAVQNTTLEERMAGALRAENVALQAAESALREGESWINTQDTQPKPSATSGPVWSLDAPDMLLADWWKTWAWASKATAYPDAAKLSMFYGDSTGLSGSGKEPRYVIQERELVKDSLTVGQQQDQTGRQFYEITARGVDLSGRGEVVLRSSFARRY